MDFRKFFPASACDQFLVGLAVRDTCVVPVYPQGNTRPRGYTFSGSVTIDSWLHDYTRVAVPSFDLIDDEADKKDSNFTVNDNHVMTWTPNGRLALTPQSYAEASQGLASQITLPLYDMIPPTTGAGDTNCNSRSRAAITRTREWFQHWIENNNDNDSAAWVPLLVDPGTGIEFEHQLEFIRAAAVERKVQGVALIGWKHIQDESLARQVLFSTRNKLQSLHLDMVVLSVDSLKQFVTAACNGCNVVGCNLAAKLAESQKALIVNLSGWKHANNGDTNESKRRRITASGDCRMERDGCVNLEPTNKSVNTHSWFSDKAPMVHGCSCYVCRTHSRSYMYHLVCAKEMLATMLLMIHNLHHLMQLLQEAESATALHQSESFQEFICEQLEEDLI
ncbi:hypothetical protein MPSEU_000214600 [Mayamaea pseudoterrestris]|nr:hypothetical protein MPSEU_000214600 [Mayamaea pseudoterrestris]